MSELVVNIATTSGDHVRTYGATWPGTTTSALDWDDEYIGTSSTNFYILGLRFTNITIPKGATITSAVLSVVPYASNSTQLHCSIYGSAEDDAATMDTTTRRPCDLTRTTASGDWNVGTTAWTAGTRVNTSDFKAVIQEITDRAGWASGNDLILLITHYNTTKASARREIGTGETDAKKPILTINYTTSSIKTKNALAKASIKTINGLAIASVKSINGLT